MQRLLQICRTALYAVPISGQSVPATNMQPSSGHVVYRGELGMTVQGIAYSATGQASAQNAVRQLQGAPRRAGYRPGWHLEADARRADVPDGRAGDAGAGRRRPAALRRHPGTLAPARAHPAGMASRAVTKGIVFILTISSSFTLGCCYATSTVTRFYNSKKICMLLMEHHDKSCAAI